MKVLILGDELGLGEPLRMALENAGHSVTHCHKVEEATFQIQSTRFDYAFVDCMLPGGMNGVDFVDQASLDSNKFFQKTKVILMSAVFIDKGFINDAVKKTKAVAFLKKQSAFSFDEAVKLVKHIEPKIKKDQYVENRKALYTLFSNEKASPRQKRRILESQEEVSGFDLPFVYSLLVETKASGYLNIYEKSGAVYGLSISNGCIVGVDLEDKTTFLGEMLIQSGYVVPQDVQEALKNQGSIKIGSRLIKNNLLSPHAFELALLEQMNLRLSRTITPEMIRINFAAADVESSNPSIDSDILLLYLHDWIASKISPHWLKALYIMWNGNSLEKANGFSEQNSVFQTPLLKALPGLTDYLEQKMTLSQIQEKGGYNEVALLKGLHLLLTKGFIVFGGKAAFRNPVEHMTILKKIESQILGKDPFAILEVFGADIGIEFNVENVIGPEPITGAPELMKLWVKLKKNFEEAVKQSSDSSIIEKSRSEAKAKELSDRLARTQYIEAAKSALMLNQFQKAQEALSKINPPEGVEFYHLLSAWAKLGQIEPAKKLVIIKEIDFELMQVPAEEKYDAMFPFVTGMLCKAKGDLNSAKKNLEKSIALNPGFIPARRELNFIENQSKGQNDNLLTMDLKNVVGGFFKKK